MVEWIDGVQAEVGIPVPALSDLRARISAADASIPQTRKSLRDEMEKLLDSQAFLREATQRYQGKKVAEAVAKTEAVLELAERTLPGCVSERSGVLPDPVADGTDGVIDISQAIEGA